MNQCQLDCLPSELLHQILANLSTTDILQSIAHVNRRLRSIALSFPYFRLDSTTCTMLAFHHYCRQISPSQIISLRLSSSKNTFDPEKSLVKNPLRIFLSTYADQYDRFRCLRKIELIGDINQRIGAQFLHSLSSSSIGEFPHLMVLSVSSIDLSDLHISAALHDLLKKCSNLQQIEFADADDMLNSSVVPLAATDVTFYHSHIDKLPMILHRFPSLRSLTVRLLDNRKKNNTSTDTDVTQSISSSSSQLTQLALQIDSVVQGEKLQNVLFNPLKRRHQFFNNLTMLNIINNFCHTDPTNNALDSIYFNGAQWEALIKVSMPHLVCFDFRFDYLWGATKEVDVEAMFSDFCSPFWCEEKRWCVLLESQVKYTASLSLYTRRYILPDFTLRFSEHRSFLCNDSSINHPFNTIENLTIAFGGFEDSSPYEQRFGPQVRHLAIRSDWDHSESLTDINEIVDLTNVDKVSLEGMLDTVDDYLCLFERAHSLELYKETMSDEVFRFPLLRQMLQNNIFSLRVHQKYVDMEATERLDSMCMASVPSMFERIDTELINLESFSSVERLYIDINGPKDICFVVNLLQQLQWVTFAYKRLLYNDAQLFEQLLWKETRLKTTNYMYEINVKRGTLDIWIATEKCPYLYRERLSQHMVDPRSHAT